MMNRKRILIALSVVSAGLLAGCSNQDLAINVDEQIKERDERISQLEEQARQSQTQLDMTQREADEAVRRATEAEANSTAAATATTTTNLTGDLLPPNAKVGECYARVLVPPVYEKTSERVLIKEASASIEIVPAKYEWVEESILVKEAGEELIVVPATYKTVTEEVLVKATSSHMVKVPAEYKTETEKVLVTPAREYWKKGRGPIEKVSGSTGEIMCLVKEAAVYKTVSRKVLVSEATTREEAIPAEYKTVTRTVVDTPAKTRTVVIPAEYSTLKVRNLVDGPREVRTPIEAEYRTVAKSAMAEASYLEWRQILCETNMTHATVLDIQNALKAKGFNPGAIDGIYGTDTQAAVNKFQDSQKLSRGALTYETVDALGL